MKYALVILIPEQRSVLIFHITCTLIVHYMSCSTVHYRFCCFLRCELRLFSISFLVTKSLEVTQDNKMEDHKNVRITICISAILSLTLTIFR